jgi:predicted transcriptional regulator
LPYYKTMPEAELDRNQPIPTSEEEDAETLAAINRGISDADAGHVTPIEQVEEKLKQWISKSFSPTKP